MVRFQLAPQKARWEEGLEMLDCQAENTLEWESGLPLPAPPKSSSGCGQSIPGTWLLPCSDMAGVAISQHRDELRTLGWRVLACDPGLVSRLGDKCRLHDFMVELELEKHLPKRYASPEAATYPCILKAAKGEYGKTVHIVDSIGQVRRLLRSFKAGFGEGARYLLQELVRGPIEHSVSLLVEDGRILRAMHTRYEYDRAAFVWPRVREVGRSSSDTPPLPHMAVLQRLVAGYSGFINVNYKCRGLPDGSSSDASCSDASCSDASCSDGASECVLVIFETNTRVGGDLVNDVPKPAARAFFEALEDTAAASLGSAPRLQHPRPPAPSPAQEQPRFVTAAA